MTSSDPVGASAAGAEKSLRHPLDPLSREELGRAAQLALGHLAAPDHLRVVDVSLHEPNKSALAGADSAGPPPREAWVVLLDRAHGSTHELVLCLDDNTVSSATELQGIQPAITPSESEDCALVVRADPRFQAALHRRDIEDPDLVTIEAWGMGTHADPAHRSRRLAWTPCWVREDPEDNPYAHPIDGLFALVDLNAMEVVEVEDHGATAIPRGSGRYRPADTGLAPRQGLRPLEIHQPEGPSFQVSGWEVDWQSWRLRIGFTSREGLVLHQITYEDRGRRRPIVHRASFAELIVPYADPGPAGYRKSAFDVGEYGIGPLTNSLELGCDCLGTIHYFDVDLCDDHGEPFTIANAVCLHEEDAGLLWKHTDARSGHAEARRMRRLVVSSVVTVDNYEYAFYWYLYQDGAVEAEVKATGIVLTQGSEAALPEYGVTVAPGLVAPHHQHFFCVRLDMQVDGDRNSVYEVNTESVPVGEANPHGNAFRPVLTRLEREREAHRSVDPVRGRHWIIANDGVRNSLGRPVAYKLVPGPVVLPFAAEDSDLSRRASFLRHNLWVTHHDRRERFPAGDYPNQHPGGAGLLAYQSADRPIVDNDIVVWYAFGMLHISRPEDWPVMPVERIGFALKPVGFFDCNPSLNVPPPPGDGHGRD